MNSRDILDEGNIVRAYVEVEINGTKYIAVGFGPQHSSLPCRGSMATLVPTSLKARRAIHARRLFSTGFVRKSEEIRS